MNMLIWLKGESFFVSVLRSEHHWCEINDSGYFKVFHKKSRISQVVILNSKGNLLKLVEGIPSDQHPMSSVNRFIKIALNILAVIDSKLYPMNIERRF
jgi:hypothetical protein